MIIVSCSQLAELTANMYVVKININSPNAMVEKPKCISTRLRLAELLQTG